MANVEAKSSHEHVQSVQNGGKTYTATCRVYCLLLIRRTELRPGPLGLSTVVWSARMMNVSPDA